MAARSSLFCHRYDPVPRSGDSSLDEEEVAIGVHPNHSQTHLGMPLRAHVARHPLPFDDAGRIGAGTDGAGLPVTRVAVRRRAAAKAVAVNDALKAAPLRGTSNLDQLARGEDVHLQFRTPRRSL